MLSEGLQHRNPTVPKTAMGGCAAISALEKAQGGGQDYLSHCRPNQDQAVKAF